MVHAVIEGKMIMKILLKILFLFFLIQIKPLFAMEDVGLEFGVADEKELPQWISDKDQRRIFSEIEQGKNSIEDPELRFSRHKCSVEPMTFQLSSKSNMLLLITRRVIFEEREICFWCELDPNSESVRNSISFNEADETCDFK